MQTCDVAYETTLKEPWVLTHSASLMAQYAWNPHAYGLDPDMPVVDRVNQVAHIVIFLPGMSGGPYCFLDWAREYQNGGILNVYTVSLEQTEEDPAPIETLVEKIHYVASQCFDQGAEEVYVSLQGHSLGAIVSGKMIFCEEELDPRIHLNMMISVAGRLRYFRNRFDWFCEDVKPTIEALYAGYVAEPDKATVYTIKGKNDELVPGSSVHFQQLPERERTITDVGHLGVLYSEETIQQSLAWTKGWILAE